MGLFIRNGGWCFSQSGDFMQSVVQHPQFQYTRNNVYKLRNINNVGTKLRANSAMRIQNASFKLIFFCIAFYHVNLGSSDAQRHLLAFFMSEHTLNNFETTTLHSFRCEIKFETYSNVHVLFTFSC